jgi:putative glutamine amidotransferase
VPFGTDLFAGNKSVPFSSQGIARVGQGLRIEAVAEDGLVEGLSVEGSQAFALGVQWHPEWQVMDNPDYRAIFRAFGEACRKRAEQSR